MQVYANNALITQPSSSQSFCVIVNLVCRRSAAVVWNIDDGDQKERHKRSKTGSVFEVREILSRHQVRRKNEQVFLWSRRGRFFNVHA